jgi:alpha-ketoglutarate-dependent taurine dioxygenase
MNWQNRVTAHSAIVDWVTGERRHLARITPQAERPYETPYVPETTVVVPETKSVSA